MSLARGKFGIEYNPRQRERESSGLGWLFVLVACVALVSLVATWISRYRAAQEEQELVESQIEQAAKPEVSVVESVPSPAVTPETDVAPQAVEKRPRRLQVLLMRREAALKARDIEMEASTIESIRQLPGSPAADLDDALARRLGTLNVARLFVKRNRQWVKEVVIKRGDSASRLAVENGSTLASLEKLNGGAVDKLVIGKKLFVMDHPHFQLVIRRRSRTADLHLNDRFFKRYDLMDEVKPAVGRYELSGSFKGFLRSCPLNFKTADRNELDVLLPNGTPILVSEM